jgi:AAHS family 4-hydroxybenzoate transporter-like MFS transporter
MPESLQFQASRGKDLKKVRAYLNRIAPEANIDADTQFLTPDRRGNSSPVVDLFRGGLATGTVLLWIINFMNLLCAYFLANWLPVVMSGAATPPRRPSSPAPCCGSAV